MTQFLSNAIVFVAIALSLAYAVWRFGPQQLRVALRTRLRKHFPHYFAAPPAPASGCGGCTGCAAAGLTRKTTGCGSAP